MTRELIAYLLLALLVAGAAMAIWRTIYNSEDNVRRRGRRERQARRKADRDALEETDPGTQD